MALGAWSARGRANPLFGVVGGEWSVEGSRARARALFRDPRRPPTLKAPLSSPTNATAQPMIVALTFSTYLKLQGLTKSAKDAR